MTNMFDPGFDPLQKLELALKNQQEIARAFNSHSDIVKQLVHQNAQLNELIKQARIEIGNLRADIEQLKARPQKEIVYNSNYGQH
jgi:predicted RNase H-like nuclease (RuvC/YqgF family)